MSWHLDGRRLRRVLVTRLRYLGDIAMATVVLDVLRRGDPDLELGFLCEESYAPLLADHPALARVHALRAPRRGADARARAAGQKVADREAAGARAGGTLATLRDLRRVRYDLAVDLFFNPRSAWLLRLAGVPRRIGGSRSSRRFLYTHTACAPPPDAPPAYATLAPGGLGDHLARLAPLRHGAGGEPFLAWFCRTYRPGELRPRVAAPAEPGPRVGATLAALGAGGGGYTLLAPAATWPTKAWPAGHWRDLAMGLVRADRAPVLVLAPPGPAGAEPDPQMAILASAIPPGRGGVLPSLGLADALRVVAGAGRVISVDGGIMHAAVAMGVPTLALFGPTDPALWFPYEALGPYHVLASRPTCAPCHRHTCDAFICLPDLRPETVLAAARRLPPRAVAP